MLACRKFSFSNAGSGTLPFLALSGCAKMKRLFRQLWADDAGFIVSSEAVFLFTIVVVGLVVGWVAIRDSNVAEWTDVANSIQALNQGYLSFGLQSNCIMAASDGSELIDLDPTLLDIIHQFPDPDPLISQSEACLPR